MKLTVERITEGIAVLEKEDMSHIEVPVSVLPEGVREGNILDYNGVIYTVDSAAENAARKRIIAKQRSIFKKK